MKTAEWIEDYKLKAESVLELGLESEIASKNLARMVLSLIKDRNEIKGKIGEMMGNVDLLEVNGVGKVSALTELLNFMEGVEK